MYYIRLWDTITGSGKWQYSRCRSLPSAIKRARDLCEKNYLYGSGEYDVADTDEWFVENGVKYVDSIKKFTYKLNDIKMKGFKK